MCSVCEPRLLADHKTCGGNFSHVYVVRDSKITNHAFISARAQNLDPPILILVL